MIKLQNQKPSFRSISRQKVQQLNLVYGLQFSLLVRNMENRRRTIPKLVLLL